MLQTACDIANFLENVTETPTMTLSVELEFKRLNAVGTRLGRFISAKI
ncbi:hypothetical protein SAMN05445850_5918 [Paraburkholderia tuberum]|uniref:Uncharacterized protein n=1 Tax=Paraburkholderia tuberum TaxID=157910 RepID=A0A1H1JY13_9BURK|nr:hypothetical protein SAMN05445850_5918 [Paraburkholderia tuberum]